MNGRHLTPARTSSWREACVLPVLLVFAATTPAQHGPSIASERTRIRATGQPGRWTGVVLEAGDEQVAAIELCSGLRWTAARATAREQGSGRSLILAGFDTAGTGGTPVLAPSSQVRFTLRRDDPFPRVDFRLVVKAFDADAWESAWSGRCPVHFLCCSVPDPPVYYVGGRVAAALSGDPSLSVGTDMRDGRADGWSATRAMGSLGIPAAGLWAPGTGRLVAYSFQHARSTDKSCKDISVACSREQQGRSGCFGLIWAGRAVREERPYPSAPAEVESHFDLLYDLETRAAGDVNRFVLGHTWSRYRELLPTVPRMSDVGWMVERHRLPGAARASEQDRPGMTDEALRLATAAVWERMSLTTDDPDETDAFDPTFLMRDDHAESRPDAVAWTAQADLLRSMIVLYAETGDARLKYYVRGALEKWHTGFAADGYHTASGGQARTEAGEGHAGLDPAHDPFWEWVQPVGDTILHVTGGRAAAIAFCKGTTGLDVSDYRFRPPANFAFTISDTDDQPLRMIFSSPLRDLSGLDVLVDGEPAHDATSAGARGEHVLFTARAGATIEIGEIGDSRAPRSESIPVHTSPARHGGDTFQGMECLDLARKCKVDLDRSWARPGSWAGLSAGRALAHGVPYVIQDPDANGGKMAVSRTDVPVNRRAAGVFLVCSKLAANEATVALTTGEYVPVDAGNGVCVRSGAPLRDWELWLYPMVLPDDAEIEAVWVLGDAHLFAITVERRDGSIAREVGRLISDARDARRAARQAEGARDAAILGSKKRVRAQLDRKLVRAALLPPHGPSAAKVLNALHELGVRATALRPAELDPEGFAPTEYPIVVCTASGRHVEDAAAAAAAETTRLGCLKKGGTLFVIGDCPAEATGNGATPPPAGGDPQQAPSLEQAARGPSTVRLERDQAVLSGVPPSIPISAAGPCRVGPGDARPPQDELIPVLTLYDAAGERSGLAMAVVKHQSPEFAGANLVWVWQGLLSDDFAHAEVVLYESLATAAELCGPASPAQDVAATAAEPYAPAVGILPLADPDRAELADRLCGELNVGCVDVSEDAFVDPLAFNAARLPIAVHASSGGAFLDSWRLPHDGADSYLRYVEQGGFLIVCGSGPPFREAIDLLGDAPDGRRSTSLALARALRLPIQESAGLPGGEMIVEPAPNGTAFAMLPNAVSVTSGGAARWWGLARVQGADVEFAPLASLSDTQGRRMEGYAAALVRRRSQAARGGSVLYVWGDLLDGALGEPVMRSALKLALDEVQESTAE